MNLMDNIMIYFLLGVLVILFLLPLVAIHDEKKDFNNGICPRCGHKLHLFDTDSQGGRGYCCHKCPYFTWISYNCVDKNFLYKK